MTTKTRKSSKTDGESGGSQADTTGPVPAIADAPPEKAITKSDTLVALLSRDEGTTIAEMMAATGWMAHSVRGFMAGTLRKRMGLAVTSEKTASGRIYRIAKADAS